MGDPVAAKLYECLRRLLGAHPSQAPSALRGRSQGGKGRMHPGSQSVSRAPGRSPRPVSSARSRRRPAVLVLKLKNITEVAPPIAAKMGQENASFREGMKARRHTPFRKDACMFGHSSPGGRARVRVPWSKRKKAPAHPQSTEKPRPASLEARSLSFGQARFPQAVKIKLQHPWVAKLIHQTAREAGIRLRPQEIGDGPFRLVQPAEIGQRRREVAARGVVRRRLMQGPFCPMNGGFEIAREEVSPRGRRGMM